jgi:hypothetical protein
MKMVVVLLLLLLVLLCGHHHGGLLALILQLQHKCYIRVSLFEHSNFFAKLEGTDSYLDQILHICLDLQETAKTKIRSCHDLPI